MIGCEGIKAMSDVQNDLRYPHMSEVGQGELAVYLDWIKGTNLADTEYAFITYVMGRAQMMPKSKSLSGRA
mgnify:CR=1 FL=1